ncbi:prepilin-type N-terminal cleavage/methylation domain-containing protein [Crenobacter intestini]|uniref:Prepilin-type N-terminal cleavage/methylation domain-containing protein n=1 Tax=Crenobacter intestini TaxID=2563443 RepID=A0A4T0UMU5_9NEIS|nr:prepilin-type N-terminal cleavage/methylation domain-containing protein [Crenobacter intestini]TIC79595.1 prepilin-type N-terminal cleavage/methylation domain-containing protein [Crenobacter intestini]
MKPMSASGPRVRRQHAGFTLVELMVAVAVGSLILAGVTSIIVSNKQGYHSAEGLSQMQESTRTAMALLERSIRGAGATVCGNGERVSNVLNDQEAGWTWATGALQGFDGDHPLPGVVIGTGERQRVAGTDAITVQSAAESTYAIESHNPSSATIELKGGTGDLKKDEILMACDADHAAIFQATNVNDSSGKLVHNSGSGTPGNCSKGLGYPADCSHAVGNAYEFKPNSTLARLSSVSWYVGNNGRAGEGGRSLYRAAQGGEPPVEVVAGVTDLQLRYRAAQSATWLDARDVTDWGEVDTVRLTLTVASGERNAAVDSTQPDGRLLRQFTQFVSLRNRTL